MSTDTPIAGDWWCPSCKVALDGSRVTYDERCDTCGTPVSIAGDGDIANLERENARLREELATRDALYKEQWQRAEQAEARALAAEKDAGNFEAVAYLHEASGVVFTTLDSAVPGTNFSILYRKNDGTFYRHPEGIFLDAAIKGRQA